MNRRAWRIHDCLRVRRGRWAVEGSRCVIVNSAKQKFSASSNGFLKSGETRTFVRAYQDGIDGTDPERFDCGDDVEGRTALERVAHDQVRAQIQGDRKSPSVGGRRGDSSVANARKTAARIS